ncbi:MAG: right-handed parallel beta-helix repeat-containing protein, partial [Myxococcales bacterium]|nr:right-handed parallel beta-helix repeat-containing protein [Myxococcales bacterium]
MRIFRRLAGVALALALGGCHGGARAADGGDVDLGSAGDGGGGDLAGGMPSCGGADAMIPAWVTSFAPQHELYVSPTGDDAHDGSSPAMALKTVAAAIARVQPSTRIELAGGTYDCASLYVHDFAGGTAAPLALRSIDGPRKARFACNNGAGLLLDNVHGIVVDGIELGQTSSHGIQVSSGGGPWSDATISSDIVIVRSYIHDTGLASFKASQAKAIAIIGNELAYANATRDNVEFVAVNDTIVAGNEAHHSGYFNEVKGGAVKARIYGNYVHDSIDGIIVGGDCTGFQFLVGAAPDFEAEDVIVWDNVVVGGNEALRVVSCHDCVVANNSWYAPTTPSGAAILRFINSGFDKGSGSCADVPTVNKNVTVVDNIFALAGAAPYVIATNQPTNMAQIGAMTNNVWFAGGSDITKAASDLPFAGESASIYADPKLA